MTSLYRALLLGAALWASLAQAEQARVKVGLGHYFTELRPGGEREPPPAVNRSASFSGPVPTNQWHSSAMFAAWPEPLYAHPASYRATAAGFEVDQPVKLVAPDSQREENDIAYPHRKSLTVAPLGMQITQTRVRKTSDWAIDLELGDSKRQMQVTVAHGSPYSYYRLNGGEVAFKPGDTADWFHRSADGKTLGLRVMGRAYAIYAPSGAHWRSGDTGAMVLQLPPGRGYFSVAVLPDDSVETLQAVSRHAYSFITDTQVSWRYDEKTSQLSTTFQAHTEAMEGQERTTLFALYPHQWHNNPVLALTLAQGYDTVRGRMKLVAGGAFQTRYRFDGILPHWPALPDGAAATQLDKFIRNDTQFGADELLNGRKPGTYWEGKGFNRAAQVMAIAEQQGKRAERDALLAAIKKRFETWFAPEDGAQRYFHYRRDLGTLIGYPDEYGSAEQLNDHHFHYGYWIFAAAQVALRDPKWAARERWGGMVELLIADIADAGKNRSMFPRLRSFDTYAGHSWASGIVPFFDGNNQESSSEAINAWAGMILWGEATGNKQIRDTGIYLYTTEVQALKHYWFDLHRLVFAPEYTNVDASMVWGSKYTHGTWFTDNPRMVHGINLLPITTASLYLGADPAYIARNLAAMDTEFKRFLQRDGKSAPDVWQDLLLSYAALNDANDAIARWDIEGAVEDGETRSHTWHWMQSLARFGRPHFGITADTPLHAVFRNADGRLTYLAYNSSAATRRVTFSDGTQLSVPPRQLAQRTSSPPK